jgi:hypothetical protein
VSDIQDAIDLRQMPVEAFRELSLSNLPLTHRAIELNLRCLQRWQLNECVSTR